MAGTEIDRQRASLTPSQMDEIERALPLAVEQGATGELYGLVERSEMSRLWEEMHGHRDAANRAARLRIKCQAAIGLIDVNETPPGGRQLDDLVILGETLPSRNRYMWRALASALDRGTLDDVFDEIEEGPGQLISDQSVRWQMTMRGDQYVPRSALRQAIVKRTADEGLENPGSLAYALGGDALMRRMFWQVTTEAKSIRSILPADRINWWQAKQIAALLGMSCNVLPLAPTPRRTMRRRQLWLTREQKRTGGRWDECYSRFRLCLQEFGTVAENNDPRWDDAYAHFHALEQIIGHAMKREAT